MRRRLLTIAIFLLAGAVVNVAVAWAIAAHLETFDIDWVFDGRVYLEDPESFKWWTTHAPDGFAKRAGWVMLSSPITGASVVLAESRRLNESYEETLIRRRQAMVRLRTGWPMRSMEGVRWGNKDGVSIYRGAIEYGGDFGANLGIFPLRPFWPGFVFNTFFHAGILWLLLPGPFVLWRFIRRLIRRRRGLCPKCAYPMGESAVCTECGNELSQRVRPAT